MAMTLFFETTGKSLFPSHWKNRVPINLNDADNLKLDECPCALVEALRKGIIDFNSLLLEWRATWCSSRDTEIPSVSDIVPETPPVDRYEHLVGIGIFYERCHLLRSICQSPKGLSVLLEKDDSELQDLVDSPILAHACYSETKVYLKYAYWRHQLLYTLATRRGIIPSSFLVTNSVRIGDQPIGRGGFADVWKGSMKEENGGRFAHRVIAVKVLRFYGEKRSNSAKVLCREAALWRMMDHPNVLTLIGICHLDDVRFQGHAALISPFAANGTLLKYVLKQESVNKMNLLAQVAAGLIHLHSIGIIHGDIRCDNVLVNSEGTPQLADFGLSSVGDSEGVNSNSNSGSTGNPRWLAPELIYPHEPDGSRKRTRESDVYALGMTALELFTEKPPFFHLRDCVVPLEVVKGCKPPRPGSDTVTDNIWVLMESCWNYDPRLRPRTIESNTDLGEFTLCSATKLGTLPPLVSSKAARVTELCAYSRRTSISEIIAKVSKRHKSRGWFYNVWDVELFARPEFNTRKILNNYPNSTCRIMNMPTLEGCYVQASRKLSDLSRKGNSRLLMYHQNVALLIAVCEILPPLKFGLIFDVGPQAEALLDYLCRIGSCNRLGILSGISKGLHYLHQLGITHGDLRSANIVVENDIARLVDYGLPQCARESRDQLECRRFRAPEILDLRKGAIETPSYQGDVYALAMTFYEVLTERLPFSDTHLSEPELLHCIVTKGLRPLYPGEVSESRGLSTTLWALMVQCWSSKASKRPLSRDAVQRVEQLRRAAL
ncbi:kinase-like protein [Schizopora paradoxa]|uniref:Kinase-like protein n=1 Tax=Schizopora paradoxa TaxID=27342 RepID=A0A0H2RAJ4_9AGAM|nr:kinase-like protein [Schizopora paradoxa]